MRQGWLRRWALLPLVPAYWLGLRMAGWARRERRLLCPVVSVGSLSAGGAGKTPLVMMLARMLQDRGTVVRVLSRGYGRMRIAPVDSVAAPGDHGVFGAVERVDAGGTAGRFGDEPLMMARRGVEVWVGADRYAAGLAAMRSEEARTGKHLHDSRDEIVAGHAAICAGHPLFLLDDGFQHRRLARELDVVLLTVQDVEDCLLPAGGLREPIGALGRADIIVLREEEAERLRPMVARRWPGKPVWVVRRRLLLDRTEVLRGVAFCGIARPEGFAEMLRAVGCGVEKVVALADHHRYRAMDARRLVGVARRVGADGFFTTEKDAVKLTSKMLLELQTVGPLVVAGLELELVEGDLELLWRTTEGHDGLEANVSGES